MKNSDTEKVMLFMNARINEQIIKRRRNLKNEVGRFYKIHGLEFDGSTNLGYVLKC